MEELGHWQLLRLVADQFESALAPDVLLLGILGEGCAYEHLKDTGKDGTIRNLVMVTC
jgi:hypothetical protein